MEGHCRRAERMRRWGWITVQLGSAPLVLLGYLVFTTMIGGLPSGPRLWLAFALPSCLVLVGQQLILSGREVGDAARFGRPDMAALAREGLAYSRPATYASLWIAALVGTGIASGFGAATLHHAGGLEAGQSERPAVARSDFLRAAADDLVSLALVEASAMAESGVYSADWRALGLVASDGVVLEIVAAPQAWSARATRTGSVGTPGCAIFVGSAAYSLATPGGITPAVAGRVACDER